MGYGFSSIHPLPSFLYYIGAIIFTMTFYHPVFLLSGLFILIIINLIQDKGKKLKSYSKFYLFMGLIIVILNPIISSRGETVLFYVFDKVITLESFLYGICTMLSLISIMILFLSYNIIITDDKFMYLFSGILPNTSFLIMMTMRFVPLFKSRAEEIAIVQKLKGGEYYKNSFKEKIKEGMQILSILVTWSLEDSIQTARSMRSRGYGIVKDRSFYFNYKMSALDIIVLIAIIILIFILLISWNMNLFSYQIYPKVQSIKFDFKTTLFFILYSLYMGIPIIIEGIDKMKWHK
ncbi:energy-coupling factor transport system permease protein [Keratinibaculum paraultunense]|uniref:Energy-coupling factor transport system permease protein n=1 Tax=Keratinibaculum paraultunense TaxID=1278232 RepID=A0A4R3L0E9_9FIRM|nr:energy-coupling factor transporter transmembrane component T [Keratinibaculum paraultunense]QQY80151.1 energy-coupling factor transporter transmembrane protein EcfT [Keratinibaculum paraultunense]TCS91528.1 energy-coupling factor transport system permease protein [Keratinibaculum paraultunense]